MAVRDLAIHPREHDLVIATHGRGIYIVDDITPLRHLTREVLAKNVAVLPTRPVTQAIALMTQDFPGDGEYGGANPPEGAIITYYLKDRHIFGKLTLEVLDSAGTVLKSLPPGTRQGINRVSWNMRLDAPKSAAAPGLGPRALSGPMVPEGRYTVRLTKGDEVVQGTIDLIPDPQTRHAAADRARQQTLVMRLYTMQGDLAFLGDSSGTLRDALRARVKGVTDKTLVGELEALASAFDAFNETLVDRTGGLAQGDPEAAGTPRRSLRRGDVVRRRAHRVPGVLRERAGRGTEAGDGRVRDADGRAARDDQRAAEDRRRITGGAAEAIAVS